MSTFLYRLGRFSYRRKWTVIIGWLMVLCALGGAALTLMKPFVAGTSIPGTEAQRALDVLGKEFPSGGDRVTGKIVFQTAQGKKVTAGEEGEAVRAATDRVAKTAGVDAVTTPSVAAGNVSADGRTGIGQITFAEEKADEISATTLREVEEAAQQARSAGMTVALGGGAFDPVETAVGGIGEAVGVLITLIVLIFVFRSLRAAIIPLATALVGVALGVLSLLALTHVVEMDSTALILALMLGLAVGVDYALFIVSRHQTQVRDGMAPEESTAVAVGTAGSAVVFAGATVVIALAALTVVRIPFLGIMGLGAALTVVIAVLLAITLLPAVLGLLGSRIAFSEIPVLRRSAQRAVNRQRAGAVTAGVRWARLMARRRRAVLLLGVVGLGALAVPAADLRLGLTLPSANKEAVRAQEMIDEAFGPGYSGTLVILVEGDSAKATESTAKQVGRRLAGLKDIASVAPPLLSQAGNAAMVSVVPASGPDSERTAKLLTDIRADRDGIERSTGTDINVTGTTAVNLDVAAKLTGALPVYCLLVMGLAVLLLTVVFRSLAVPLKAALGFLLSLGGSLGVLVAVLQWGWFSSVLGTQASPTVISFLPILLVGILFGLAMDYEVFLVSRMREEYTRDKSPVRAMVDGFGHGSKVVTAAAVIMVSVFGSFVFSDMQVTKGMGLALAVGVLLDAFVVRMALVPAAMAVLRHTAWWLPGFLQRTLPHIDVEGEKLTRGQAPQTHFRPSEDLITTRQQ
ncbi:MMPL family transporter [Streptomyces phaeochromogenes]|uniref:MMPL family transporter n=1 Tax=Streptomyces phaeochromogenes TaxID=1923 RepID=UPI0036D1BD68